jgi:hypothetical protein
MREQTEHALSRQHGKPRLPVAPQESDLDSLQRVVQSLESVGAYSDLRTATADHHIAASRDWIGVLGGVPSALDGQASGPSEANDLALPVCSLAS